MILLFYYNYLNNLKITYSIKSTSYGFGLWCNGNTADFGSAVLGSSPGSPTKSDLKRIGKNRLLLGKGKFKKDSR